MNIIYKPVNGIEEWDLLTLSAGHGFRTSIDRKKT